MNTKYAKRSAIWLIKNETRLLSKYKTCSLCKNTKIKSEFHTNKISKDGFCSWCKICKSIKDKKYRDENIAEIRENQRLYSEKNAFKAREKAKKWKIDNPDRVKVNHQKRRARKRDASTGNFTVLDWINIKQFFGYECPACYKREPEIKLTMDHIIPLVLGGIHGINNIQPLCFSCNSRKNKNTVDYRIRFMAA